jgi:ubiquinone/menaquinone biosynthesis C-methylase UbiE/DNA-binding transcriptional ArsR family regulator
MEVMLGGLRAAAEPTRLRMLALCAHAELTVTDLTQILGQSQPRVSRHLKLLCDAGLLDRSREGTWAFYRLAQRGACATLAATLLDLLPPDDSTLIRDRERLARVRAQRAEAASAYFSENAAEWARIRSLHIDEAEVESVLMKRVGQGPIDEYLDIGTGTGRLLELIGPKAKRALGIDMSREMLGIARANLERLGLRNCTVRQADLYQLPVESHACDVVTMHQVLHYLETPGLAIAEAARVLKVGGRLVIVDFAPHNLEELREKHAHRRLGFRKEEVADWCRDAGLRVEPVALLPGDKLTVAIWSATLSHAPQAAVDSIRQPEPAK